MTRNGGQDQPPDLFSTPSRSAEAGLKSFFAGAVASAFLLYGIALVWGEVGRTDYFQLGTLLPGGVSTLGNIGLVFILIGFAFKVALAPFHLWAPDARRVDGPRCRPQRSRREGLRPLPLRASRYETD